MGLPSVIEAALLPGLVGWGRTREMLLTGAIYSAADALAMRFVQKVVPAAGLDAAIEPWLAAIRHAKPAAVRVTEGAHQSLGAGVAAGGDLRRHRCALRGLQDRRAAGSHHRILRRQEEAQVVTKGNAPA